MAHIRHRETAYDELLASGEVRQDARALVRGEVAAVLERWSRPTVGPKRVPPPSVVDK